MYRGGVKREMAGGGANAVRAKQLLHSDLSPYLLSAVLGARSIATFESSVWLTVA
jgi:hypothetical protein